MKNMMKYKGYYGSAHFDADDILFYGKVEFIRGLVSYDATTAKGLIKAFKEAVDDYLDLCQQQDNKPETPLKGSLNVRLPQDLHHKLAVTAKRKHISINKLIADTLEKALD